MTRKLIQQDRHPVDTPTALKVRLDILRGDAVVDIADKDTPAINVLLVVTLVGRLLVERRLHLAQLLRFGLHLRDALLHLGDFILYPGSAAHAHDPDQWPSRVPKTNLFTLIAHNGLLLVLLGILVCHDVCSTLPKRRKG